jgi:hypothetical protein
MNENKTQTVVRCCGSDIEFIVVENYANRISLRDAIINILYSKYMLESNGKKQNAD